MTRFKRSHGAFGKIGRQLCLVLVLSTPWVLGHVDRSMAAAPEQPFVYVVEGSVGLVEMPVLAGEDSWLDFPSDIRRAYTAQRYPDFTVEQLHQRIRIRAASGVGTDAEMRIFVESATVQIDLLVRVVTSRDQAVRVGKIQTRSEVEAAQARIDSAVEQVTKDRDEREIQFRRDQLRALLDPPMVPARGQGRSDPGPVELQIVRAIRSADDLNVIFELTNHQSNPVDIVDVRTFIRGQRHTDSQTIMVNLPTSGKDGLIASVPPDTRIAGVLSVPGGAKYGIPPLRLDLGGPLGVRLTMAAATEWTIEQSVALFNKSERNREKDELADGRITLDVQALYGAIWLADGIGLNELGVAPLSGLGVRVGYGINRLLSFEGAVVGASSGAACFMAPAGELERSMTLGRVYMGGLLRFGERIMPTARAGLGLQGATQRSKMLDGSMDESAFEIGFLLGAGVGLDVRLGAGLLLGLGISGEQNLTTGTPSFDSGIHLGYAWTP